MRDEGGPSKNVRVLATAHLASPPVPCIREVEAGKPSESQRIPEAALAVFICCSFQLKMAKGSVSSRRRDTCDGKFLGLASRVLSTFQDGRLLSSDIVIWEIFRSATPMPPPLSGVALLLRPGEPGQSCNPGRAAFCAPPHHHAAIVSTSHDRPVLPISPARTDAIHLIHLGHLRSSGNNAVFFKTSYCLLRTTLHTKTQC